MLTPHPPPRVVHRSPRRPPVRSLLRPLVATGLLVPVALAAQRAPYTIAYQVAISDPSAHLYDITLDVGGALGQALPLQLPVWSPGRYARMDFARNVQEFRATDPAGAPLRWEKTDGSRWVVNSRGARAVRVRYRVFANALSGTFSVLDSAHANWNGAPLFLYVEGHKPDPVTLTISTPAGWQVINGDTRAPNQRVYRFENYDRLIDTPTEVAPAFLTDSFTVDGRTYVSAVHHNGSPPPGVRGRFVSDLEKIVRYENTVFGAPPLERYTFLFHIGYAGRDGMEHLFSTQIIDPRPWTDSLAVLPGVGTAAHEYFHVWNVKRVRPRALGPFDYTHEVYQPSLWVAEGWTQYYGLAALHRSGVTPREEFYRAMAGVIRANLTAPGRREVSARMASFHAPFWDAAAQPQPTNAANTFFSYYTKGAGLALYLDLWLRASSDNRRSLDDAFAALTRLSWGAPRTSYYLPGRGYTERDVEQAVSEVAGEDMHPWFDRYVGGTDDLDYDSLLGRAGLRLIRGGDAWRIEELSEATAAQRVVREGWVRGRREPTPPRAVPGRPG